MSAATRSLLSRFRLVLAQILLSWGVLACSNAPEADQPSAGSGLGVSGQSAGAAGTSVPAAGNGTVAGASATTPSTAVQAAVSGSGGAGVAISGSGSSAAGQTGSSGTGVAGRAAGAGAGGTSTTGGSGAAGSVGGGNGGSSGMAGSSSALEHFSFFVTSLEGMQRLSKSENGFGGDLRYGQADGLTGADKICTDLAEYSMPGSGSKGWHAFLSVKSGPDGKQVNAIDRVGEGPWYDRQGRIVAMNKAALLNTRPQGADPAILNDLPNEFGVPNHRPDPSQPEVDNHHVLTGSDTSGKLYQNNVNATCANWTSTAANAGKPQVGVSWIAGNRTHWISQFSEGGCGAKVSIVEMGGPTGEAVVGSGGGYGAFYCFALTP